MPVAEKQRHEVLKDVPEGVRLREPVADAERAKELRLSHRV